MSGWGRLEYSSGLWYEGEFVNGKPHGTVSAATVLHSFSCCTYCYNDTCFVAIADPVLLGDASPTVAVRA